ncbi:DUF5723 family protein [Limibacter armeniacum]|uniref:DUF5723 family protein n=1 Tax=Limibacter armeniacum TaxID=466084 RepID=UPI002FE51198
MKNIYKWLAAALFSISAIDASAQHSSAMHFMTSLPQSTHQNPARRLNHKVSILLPVIGQTSADLTTDLSFNKLFTKGDNGKYFLDIDKVAANIEGESINRMQSNINLLGVYFNGKKVSVRVSVQEIMDFHVGIPADLPGIISKGPASEQYLGKEVNIAPSLSFQHYHNIVLGGAYDVNEKLTVGVNLNAKVGVQALQMEDARLTIKQEDAPNYPISTSSDAQIYASAGYVTINTETNEIEVDSDNLDSQSFFDPSNFGLMFDFGATYRYTDRITFEASLLNVGSSVKWKSNLLGYSVTLDEDKLAYEGADPALFASGEEEDLFDLEDAYSFDEIDEVEAFKIKQALRFNVGASYELARNLTAGALVSATGYRGSFIPGISLSIDQELGDFLGLGLSYEGDRFGHKLGSVVTMGFPGVKFYLASDNLISTGLWAKNAQAMDAQVGLVLNFGRSEIFKEYREIHRKKKRS